eukprot:GFYU01005852.1.p1 GENE.GFYU01005852.1~~GFYU01005852.1.p1  ORF type:complete len:726 (-),score=132.54 GFYU01005852.1:177-2354(-)
MVSALQVDSGGVQQSPGFTRSRSRDSSRHTLPSLGSSASSSEASSAASSTGQKTPPEAEPAEGRGRIGRKLREERQRRKTGREKDLEEDVNKLSSVTSPELVLKDPGAQGVNIRNRVIGPGALLSVSVDDDRIKKILENAPTGQKLAPLREPEMVRSSDGDGHGNDSTFKQLRRMNKQRSASQLGPAPTGPVRKLVAIGEIGRGGSKEFHVAPTGNHTTLDIPQRHPLRAPRARGPSTVTFDLQGSSETADDDGRSAPDDRSADSDLSEDLSDKSSGTGEKSSTKKPQGEDGRVRPNPKTAVNVAAASDLHAAVNRMLECAEFILQPGLYSVSSSIEVSCDQSFFGPEPREGAVPTVLALKNGLSGCVMSVSGGNSVFQSVEFGDKVMCAGGVGRFIDCTFREPLEIQSGDFSLERCTLEMGVTVSSLRSSVKLNDCIVRRGGATPVAAKEGKKAPVFAGVYAKSNCRVEITKTRIETSSTKGAYKDSLPDGVVMAGNSLVNITDTEIYGFKQGLTILSCPSVRVMKVNVSDCASAAAVVSGASEMAHQHVVMMACKFTKNYGDGLVVRDEAKCELLDSQVTSNKGAGIVVCGRGSLQLSGVASSKNVDSGVTSSLSALLKCVRSTFSANGGHGVVVGVVDKAGDAHKSRDRKKSVAQKDEYKDVVTTAIKGCNISKNRKTGISTMHSASGRKVHVERCKVLQNVEGAMTIADPDVTTLKNNNTD